MDRIEDFFNKHKDEFDFIDTNPADWKGVRDELHSKPTKVKNLRSLWAAAASIALLIGLSFYFYGQPRTAQQLTGLETDMQFPNVELRNPDGEFVALSDLKADIVLVEFWASYCMVCTEEQCYYFKPLYNEYKDRGFEIYAVSADSSAMSWVNAIQRNQLDWVQVSDLNGFESPLMNQLAVNGLPTNYLLDKTGRILAKNINVDELEEKLNQLLTVY